MTKSPEEAYLEAQEKYLKNYLNEPTDPTFLNPSDEWFKNNPEAKYKAEERHSQEWTKDSSAWDKFKEQLKPRQDALLKKVEIETWIEQGLKDIKNHIQDQALVAQRSEQDAHNVLVTGSSPVEGTTPPFKALSAREMCDLQEENFLLKKAIAEIDAIMKKMVQKVGQP